MEIFFFSIREANLLRSRFRLLLSLRNDFLNGKNHNTIHDLRVASRRVREILDYHQTSLPLKWFIRLMELARVVTKTLGRAREVEVNMLLLRKSYETGSMDPAVAEFMIFEQQQSFASFCKKALNRISDKRFERFTEFLDQLRGSRSLVPADSDILLQRKNDFISFSWEGTMDDERLHDLRIRSKKFRYTLEIYDRLHEQNLGKFIRHVKSLQELLGDIHDLYVLEQLFASRKIEWERSNLSVLPRSLERATQELLKRKKQLIPEVFPLYSSILQNGPSSGPLSLREPEVSPESMLNVPVSL